ncbi:PAS domain-containing protein [Undibacterium sp. Jales W-56]|uniref:two-component system sensor histidine kinase NtrB n=1 Tax=Undibacterium sp. Jales W-56 TaxID=2897325 RepID=UPI0021CE0401|nr:ATP-binding protein [Undibacterium sp. Jales W-56]MCU6432364.1 PAS domain-containing protein [Undibacterium sp. Jales W-56]
MNSQATVPSATFWRSLQTLNVSRLVVAIVLLAYLNLRNGKDSWLSEQLLLSEACVAYLIIAIAFIVLKFRHRKHFRWQLAAQIALDIIVISIMYLASGGNKSGLAILYLFPLAGVGILAPLLWGLSFAAFVTLFLLMESIYRILQQEDVSLSSQAGLYGAAYFAVVYLVNRLAKNLIQQENLATERGQALAIQQAINRLVIADMGDGILVVDQTEHLVEMNPAAERMLGAYLMKETSYKRLRDIPALIPIAEVLSTRKGATLNTTMMNTGVMPWAMEENISFISIRHAGDATFDSNLPENNLRSDFMSHLKLRFMDVDSTDIDGSGQDQASYTIIFMQDVSDIENQAQQLKLASMGRLTASIAHEVRNPLSSISYAASLLNEDISNPSQTQRLLKIVDDNVARLNQLIEDILKLSRKAQADTKPFSLLPMVMEIVQDFVETRGLSRDLIYVDGTITFPVVFDVGHLREVIVNLLSNATRYASGAAGSIKLFAQTSTMHRLELHIQDDGPGIGAEVRSHLFEPFYTTSSKGTGLGLYMARELCLNNHALLDYEYHTDDPTTMFGESRGRFVINFSLTESSAHEH